VRRAVIRRSLANAWADFRSARLAMVGLIIVIVFGIGTFIHPLLIGRVWATGIYDPLTGFDPRVVHPAPPHAWHWLGTDSLGRDVLSMLLAGARPTWVLAVTAALVTAVVALLLSSVGAFFRGIVDGLLSRVSDAFLLLPAPIFMVVIGSGEFSQRIGPVIFGILYGIIAGAGAGAIVLRSHALKVMAAPYVEAARAAGGSSWHIITRHLLPHLYPLAVLFMMLSVVGAVVAEGFASFFGQTATRLTWGTIVYLGVTFRNPTTGQVAWNAVAPPALALSLFAAAFYLMSVGLRDIADPRHRSSWARHPR
jgi:peptide/nickel transport system permease protein